MSDFIQITIGIRKTDQLFSISVAPSCPLSSLFSVPACVNILEMLNVRDLAGFKLREVRIWSEKVLNVAPRPGSILSEAFWVAIFYFCGPPTLVPFQIGGRRGRFCVSRR